MANKFLSIFKNNFLRINIKELCKGAIMKNNTLSLGFILIVALGFVVSCGHGNGKPIRKGDKVPTFSTIDINGNRISLDDYKGNPVILRFWSTDCKFCKADTPIFNRYFDEFKDKGLKVVYINTAQTEQEVREFIDDLDIVFPVVLDKDKMIAKSFNVRIEPMTIIITPEQKLLTAILGGVGEAELKELAGKYL